MEYLRREGDARLAALNTRREPGTQGKQDRTRNDDDDGLGETTPSEVSARRDMFSGLPEEEVVKIFKNKFKPMNLYKMRHLHGFENTQEEDGIVVENGTLKPRKTTGTLKDFGKSVNEVWSESFVNYMLVINILFETPELSAALLLFYRQIMTLARRYDWLKGVLPLALGWHKYAVIRSPLDPSNWKIAHAIKSATVTTSRYEAHSCWEELNGNDHLCRHLEIRKPPTMRTLFAKDSTRRRSSHHGCIKKMRYQISRLG